MSRDITTLSSDELFNLVGNYLKDSRSSSGVEGYIRLSLNDGSRTTTQYICLRNQEKIKVEKTTPKALAEIGSISCDRAALLDLLSARLILFGGIKVTQIGNLRNALSDLNLSSEKYERFLILNHLKMPGEADIVVGGGYLSSLWNWFPFGWKTNAAIVAGGIGIAAPVVYYSETGILLRVMWRKRGMNTEPPESRPFPGLLKSNELEKIARNETIPIGTETTERSFSSYLLRSAPRNMNIPSNSKVYSIDK